MRKVLILGGYGNFGKRIAKALTKKGVRVIVAGRNREKANRLACELLPAHTETACFDVTNDLRAQLETLKPAVVINTCGPFQTSNYNVANTCIERGVHYIDLADGRAFVAGITALDALAKQHSVSVISGASTVPGLSSAVIEYFKSDFFEIDSLRYGITPGQKAEKGLATTRAIMSYVGKPLKAFGGSDESVYGWQDIYRQYYPELGPRWMANCDIPDLDIFPIRYGIRSIQFSAGLELGFMHLVLWLLSWAVRLGVPINLPKYADAMLKISNWFNGFGTADGGMHVMLRGRDSKGDSIERCWFIIAKNGDGPQIPTIPAIILAEKLVSGKFGQRGAMACVGLITLGEYMDELKEFNISSYLI
ncbi:MAG: SDR family NAD(P)-dependent oxidoreductase [Aestuariivirga sp.]